MAIQISRIVPQLRTRNLDASLAFYTGKLGFTVDFRYDDFYAGVRSGTNVVHLKLVDAQDPSIDFVDRGEHFHLYFETADVERVAAELKRQGVPLVQDVHETPWGTRECVVRDNEGHTLYFGQRSSG